METLALERSCEISRSPRMMCPPEACSAEQSVSLVKWSPAQERHQARRGEPPARRHAQSKEFVCVCGGAGGRRERERERARERERGRERERVCACACAVCREWVAPYQHSINLLQRSADFPHHPLLRVVCCHVWVSIVRHEPQRRDGECKTACYVSLRNVCKLVRNVVSANGNDRARVV